METKKYFQFRIESKMIPTNRRFIASSIKIFDDYFVNRFQKNVDPNGVCWIDEVILDVVIDGNYVSFNGIKHFIYSIFDGSMGHVDIVFLITDDKEILFYDILSPKERALRSTDWYVVYKILYDKSKQYYNSLPVTKTYHDVGLYSKEDDRNDDSGCVSYVVDYDNFTDIDHKNYKLYQQFQDKANEISRTYIDM